MLPSDGLRHDQPSEYTRVLPLFFDWTIKVWILTSPSPKFCKKRHLLPYLLQRLLEWRRHNLLNLEWYDEEPCAALMRMSKIWTSHCFSTPLSVEKQQLRLIKYFQYSDFLLLIWNVLRVYLHVKRSKRDYYASSILSITWSRGCSYKKSNLVVNTLGWRQPAIMPTLLVSFPGKVFLPSLQKEKI